MKVLSVLDIPFILGKIVHLTSDCDIFPNFNVTGKVTGRDISKTGEHLIYINIKHKRLTVGLNMKNLRFEIIS